MLYLFYSSYLFSLFWYNEWICTTLLSHYLSVLHMWGCGGLCVWLLAQVSLSVCVCVFFSVRRCVCYKGGRYNKNIIIWWCLTTVIRDTFASKLCWCCDLCKVYEHTHGLFLPGSGAYEYFSSIQKAPIIRSVDVVTGF